MSAKADTNCHDIFNIVLATRTHLAKIGATRCVVADMSRHVGDIYTKAGNDTASIKAAADYRAGKGFSVMT